MTFTPDQMAFLEIVAKSESAKNWSDIFNSCKLDIMHRAVYDTLTKDGAKAACDLFDELLNNIGILSAPVSMPPEKNPAM